MLRLLLFTLFLGAACAAPPPSPDWDDQMSLALSARGKTLAEQGDLEAGRSLATEALTLARSCGSLRAQARSLALMAWIDRSYSAAEEALQLTADEPDSVEIWDLRLLLAELALSKPPSKTPAGLHWALLALGHAEAVIKPANLTENLPIRAEYEGTARHLAARAHRLLGDQARATYEERQAALVLTLLPNEALPALRQSVFQGRGDDLAREGAFQEAFVHHVQAQMLAEQLGDHEAEMTSMAGRSTDLAGLGRLLDASQMALTLANLALSREHTTVARDSAQRGLAWLDAQDPFGYKSLRLSLLTCLREIDAITGIPPRGSGE